VAQPEAAQAAPKAAVLAARQGVAPVARQVG
jgi:hypothetical protein